MIGDLSLRPAAAVEPPPSTHRAPERPAAAVAQHEPTGSSGTDGPHAPVREAADRLRQLITDPGMRVLTHRDDASGRTVMQIEDRATGETVDQFPADELLRLYAALRASLIDEKA